MLFIGPFLFEGEIYEIYKLDRYSDRIRIYC